MMAKSVLITGANRGLGLEFVKQLVKLPTPPQHVFATCRNPCDAQALQDLAENNPSVHILKLDAQNSEHYKEVVAEVGKHGGLNLLINNAGINTGGRLLADQTREKLLNHFDVNVVSPLMMSQAFLPLLKQAAESAEESGLSCSKAAFVNISSILGSVTHNTGGTYAYRVSKSALNMATNCLALELASQGIMALSLHPGWVQTDMGGPKAPVTPKSSIAGMLRVLGTATEEHNGKLLDYTGQILPW